MDEDEIRALAHEVKRGRLGRRAFVRTMVGLGLTAPLAQQALTSVGVARAQPGAPAAAAPTRRGGGGRLRLLWWQAPTLLNGHFATGTKDQDACRPVYEPLASFDPDGNFVPILAAEIPTAQNGGLSRDGKTVTWRLKKNVAWHDGKPFTADDVVFTWEYAADPATAAVTVKTYAEIQRVDKVDDHTVKVVFREPRAFWYDAFFGVQYVMPRHLFGPYKGGNSRNAPFNDKPVGTGPYRVVDFKPQDSVRYELNPTYHVPNRPFFDVIELKGGGDATSAARAVLQTGEFDYAWNVQVEWEVLKRLETPGKGVIVNTPTGNVEHIQMNQTDPWTEVDGERSSIKTRHPLFQDLRVRQAMALLVDRATVAEELYGPTGQATGNFLNAPPRYQSKTTRWEFSIDKANRLLDEAGYRRGPDGMRVGKDGKRIKLLFSTSTNSLRQKNQAIVKQACAKAGLDVELKSVVAGVFFSSDATNTDTYPHFYADLQMYNTTMTSPDPQYFMNQFLGSEAAQKANKWAGRNPTRWRNEEYDKLWTAAEVEFDAVKRAAMFVKMNDLLWSQAVVIPENWRNRTAAMHAKLRGLDLSGWDSTLWHIAHWYREA